LIARRISAISIAERVAQEQCLDVGGLVGYQVRLENAVCNNTQLVFLTPGVLVRKLQSSPMLLEYTHIVLDEIHEHDKYTDFLLIALRDLLPRRPNLRLVLMSATLQTQRLLDYFESSDHDYFERHPPSVVTLEGRTFPVQEFYLEDVLQMTNYVKLPSSFNYTTARNELATSFPTASGTGSNGDVMTSVAFQKLLDQYKTMHDDERVDTKFLLKCLRHIVKSSTSEDAVLVFLPGWQEISEFQTLLERSMPFGNQSAYLILPLHSGINSRDQRRVLQRPPAGVRKIVLSTNIAETSLTIVRSAASLFARMHTPFVSHVCSISHTYRMTYLMSWTRAEQR
jgi:HrpA-like RNA helicase